MLPGIIDAHTHPAESAQDLAKCNLGDEMLNAGRRQSEGGRLPEEHPDARLWFEVVQVNPSGLTLTLKDLDSMLADRPLILSGSDGHTLWANSAALNAAHVTAANQGPCGGRIEHDAGRQSDRHAARRRGRDRRSMPCRAPSLEHEAAQLARAFDAMRATGITSVQDADADDHDHANVQAALRCQHRLNMRVRATFGLKDTARSGGDR